MLLPTTLNRKSLNVFLICSSASKSTDQIISRVFGPIISTISKRLKMDTWRSDVFFSVGEVATSKWTYGEVAVFGSTLYKIFALKCQKSEEMEP